MLALRPNPPFETGSWACWNWLSLTGTPKITGYEHYLSLSTQHYSASGIEVLDPKDRKCFFANEGDLDFYEKYTFQNCKFECGIKLVEEQLGCIPWYLPQGVNTTACDPWQARQFSHMLGEIYSDPGNCGHCLPDCDITETTVMPSAAKFRQQLIHIHVNFEVKYLL